MRSLVGWGMERPGTSFRTTETVAGFNPKCSPSFFRLILSFPAGGFFPKSRFFLSRPPRVHFGRRNAPPRKCAFPELEIFTGLSTRRLRLHACGAFAELILAQAPDFCEATADFSLIFPYEIQGANLKAPGGTGRILPLKCRDRCWVQSQVEGLRSRLALNVLASALIGEHQNMTSIGILKGHVINIGERSFGTDHARASLNDFRIVRERPILPAARYRVRLGIQCH